MTDSKRASKQKRPADKKLSLWPLTLEEAVEAVVEAGPMPKKSKVPKVRPPSEDGRVVKEDTRKP